MRGALALLLLFAVALPAAAAPLVYRGEQTLYRDTVWTGEVWLPA